MLAAGCPTSAVIEAVGSFVIDTVGSSTTPPEGLQRTEYNSNQKKNHDEPGRQDDGQEGLSLSHALADTYHHSKSRLRLASTLNGLGQFFYPEQSLFLPYILRRLNEES
jgi:hypothetical protein